MARLYLVQSEPIVQSELRQFHKEKYDKSNHQIKCCIIFQSWEVKTQMWFRPTSKCSEFILKYTENHFYLKVWTNNIFTPSILPWSSHEGLFCACLIAFYQQKKKLQSVTHLKKKFLRGNIWWWSVHHYGYRKLLSGSEVTDVLVHCGNNSLFLSEHKTVNPDNLG